MELSVNHSVSIACASDVIARSLETCYTDVESWPGGLLL